MTDIEKKSSKRQEIEFFIDEKGISEELLLLDGLDEAFVGCTFNRKTSVPVAIYDRELIIRTLMEDNDWDVDEAEEWCSFNVESAYVGKNTPIIMEAFRPITRPSIKKPALTLLKPLSDDLEQALERVLRLYEDASQYDAFVRDYGLVNSYGICAAIAYCSRMGWHSLPEPYAFEIETLMRVQSEFELLQPSPIQFPAFYHPEPFRGALNSYWFEPNDLEIRRRFIRALLDAQREYRQRTEQKP